MSQITPITQDKNSSVTEKEQQPADEEPVVEDIEPVKEPETLEEKFEILEEKLNITRSDSMVGGDVRGIPTEQSIGYQPQNDVLVLSLDQIQTAQMMCGPSDCNTLPHPLALLYAVKIMGKKPRLEQYLKRIVGEEKARWYMENTSVVQSSQDKELVVNLGRMIVTVQSPR